MRHLLLFLAGLFVTVSAVFAAELDTTKLAAIAPRLQQFVDAGTISGAVTVIGSSRGIARIDAVGSRSLTPPTPMTRDTVFRIASMTKPMVAAGIFILVDESKLKVSDPVEKYLPEFRGQMIVEKRSKDRLVLRQPTRPITLHDLLTHTSGLPFYPPGLSDLYVKRGHTLAEATLAVSQRPLDFEPGSRWAYCNSGIDTLGRIIEVVSGQPFETFMTQRIFAPLGMKDTCFIPTEEQKKRLATIYDTKSGKLVEARNLILGPPEKSRHPIPAGGLYSSGTDVARFYQMMLQGGSFEGKKILSKDAVKTLTTVQTGELKTGFSAGMGFGYGFAVVRKPEGVTSMLSEGSFGHGGAFGTQSWADPKKDLFVILLIQRTGLPNADQSEMRSELQRLAVEALRK